MSKKDRWSRGMSFGPFAVVVQLGERQTEDLDVAGSSPAYGTFFIKEYLVSLFTNYFLENIKLKIV